jgi:hypothetical protein
MLAAGHARISRCLDPTTLILREHWGSSSRRCKPCSRTSNGSRTDGCYSSHRLGIRCRLGTVTLSLGPEQAFRYSNFAFGSASVISDICLEQPTDCSGHYPPA